ncbi:unnamed protein product [Sphagnum tenellum]
MSLGHCWLAWWSGEEDMEKNTLMGMQLGRRSILWLQQQWIDGSSGDACRSVLHFRFWQCECSTSLGKNCLRI